MTRQHIVFLTGAGVSAESGLSTFRGKDGMWTNEEWVHLASTDALYNETHQEPRLESLQSRWWHTPLRCHR